MNSKLSSIVTAIVMVAVVVIGNGAPAQAAGQRALWVWDGPVEGVIDFATSNGISALYLHTPPGFSRDEAYEPFITEAHSAGLDVLATGGDPSWSTDASTWSSWVDEIVDFGGFDGIVFDVEPHTLPQWESRRQNRLIRSYLSALQSASLQAGSLPTFTTVPFWWDDPAFKSKKHLLVEHVLDRTDGIIIMAYRDHALGIDGIVEHSQTEADLASAAGKQFTIGVETGFAGLNKVSFFEEGAAAMEIELGLVEAAFATTPGHWGISIHHFASYATMAP